MFSASGEKKQPVTQGVTMKKYNETAGMFPLCESAAVYFTMSFKALNNYLDFSLLTIAGLNQ